MKIFLKKFCRIKLKYYICIRKQTHKGYAKLG